MDFPSLHWLFVCGFLMTSPSGKGSGSLYPLAALRGAFAFGGILEDVKWGHRGQPPPDADTFLLGPPGSRGRIGDTRVSGFLRDRLSRSVSSPAARSPSWPSFAVGFFFFFFFSFRFPSLSLFSCSRSDQKRRKKRDKKQTKKMRKGRQRGRAQENVCNKGGILSKAFASVHKKKFYRFLNNYIDKIWHVVNKKIVSCGVSPRSRQKFCRPSSPCAVS